jgi:Fe2+ or Zn2+ uptake regulation protein
VAGELDERIRAAVAAAGQRMTRQRAAVVAAMLDAHRPLTADELVRGTSLPQSTVYRNLAELCEAGVAVRVPGPGRIDRFEAAEEYSGQHHHHLVCSHCGAVHDFHPSAALERAIRNELASIDRGEFVATAHVFDVHGRCADCPASV